MADYVFAEQSHAGPETNTGRNSTGIPDRMKQDFENRSGLSFDDVRIHYNSGRPARFQSLAYTQGANVYIAPGQEKHLGHELGHVLQQKQGMVRPAIRYENALLNNDPYLENQADRFAAGSFTGYRSGGASWRRDVIQPKTEVTLSPGYYDYNYDFRKGGFQNRVTVGREMDATLDPEDPITGSSASGETHVHMHLLHYLKNKWGSSIIRGHLLNDHLGGLSVEENLFPISSNANKEHLNKIERFVKGFVYKIFKNDDPAVHYRVAVLNENNSQKFDEFHPKTRFHCEVETDFGGGVNAAYDVWSDVSDNTSNRDDSGPFRPGIHPYSNNNDYWGTSRGSLTARPEEGTEYTLTRSSGEEMAQVCSSHFPFIGSVPNVPFATLKGWSALSNFAEQIPDFYIFLNHLLLLIQSQHKTIPDMPKLLNSAQPSGFFENCRLTAVSIGLITAQAPLPWEMYAGVLNKLLYTAFSAANHYASLEEAADTIYNSYEKNNFSEILTLSGEGTELPDIINADNEDILCQFESKTRNAIIDTVCLRLRLKIEARLYDEILMQIAFYNNSEQLNDTVWEAVLHDFLSPAWDNYTSDTLSTNYIEQILQFNFKHIDPNLLIYNVINLNWGKISHPVKLSDSIPYLDTVIPKAASYVSGLVYERFNKTKLDDWIYKHFTLDLLNEINYNLWLCMAAGQDTGEIAELLLKIKAVAYMTQASNGADVVLEPKKRVVDTWLDRYIEAFYHSQQELFYNILYHAVYEFIKTQKLTYKNVPLNQYTYEQIIIILKENLFLLSEGGIWEFVDSLKKYTTDNLDILINNASADYNWMDCPEISSGNDTSFASSLSLTSDRQKKIISDALTTCIESKNFYIKDDRLIKILSQAAYQVIDDSIDETSEDEMLPTN